MTFRVENTSEWDEQEFSKHSRAVTFYLKKYVEAFPEFETLENIAQEVISGNRQLWCVFNDGDICAAFLTQVDTVNATSKRVLRYTEIAGDDMLGAVSEIDRVVGNYAKNIHKCDFIELVGRTGWLKVLKPLGFTEAVTIYRKPIHGQQVNNNNEQE